MSIVIAVAVFIAALCAIEGAFLLLRDRLDGEARAVRARLRALADVPSRTESGDVKRNRPLSAIPWLDRLLARVSLMGRLDDALLNANVVQPLAVFVLLSFVLLSGGFCACLVLSDSLLFSALFAVLLSTGPTLYVVARKRRRMQKFERQLPDALDLIARSLRAGHALSTGLRMVAREFDDPIGTEFQKTQAQIALGASIEQAVKALTERIDCADLKFFAVSIIVQRETGGNLAEILENISTLIRGRFRLRGRIRSLSAEARLSATILISIPFAMAFVLWFVNPSYIEILFKDSIGRRLVFAALLMMMLGVVVIRRMVRSRF
jgi:tight adherence protein B